MFEAFLSVKISNITDNNLVSVVNKFASSMPEAFVPNKVTLSARIGNWVDNKVIHNWIIDVLNDGFDTEREIFINTDILQELLDNCIECSITPSSAVNLFPRETIDDKFWEAMNYTINLLGNAVSNADKYTAFYYQASY